MEATIKINMDNAAFEDGFEGRVELARILEKLANSLELSIDGPENAKALFDIHGNKVGTFTFA